MMTLFELRKRMKEGTPEEKLAAAMEVVNFLLIYNEEFNMLLELEAAAKVAHFQVIHNPNGINQAHRLQLEALLTHISARKSLLDLQIRAFQNSEIGIAAPDEAAIDKVKALTDKVAAMALRDNAIKAILTSLAEIANLVDGTMSGDA